MNKKQFKHCIKRGRGNVIIEVQNSPDKEKYREIILWACRNSLSYCPEMEESRGQYLYDIITSYGDRDYFEEKIVQKYSFDLCNANLMKQLSELLYLFAKDGSKVAREALNSKYEFLFKKVIRNKNNGSLEFEKMAEWMFKLNGFRGFKKIVKQVGEFILRGNSQFELDYFYFAAEDYFGVTRVHNYFMKMIESSLSVEGFYQQYLKNKKAGIVERKKYNIYKIMDCIEKEELVEYPSVRKYINNATEDERKLLANEMLEEEDKGKKIAYLECFVEGGYPLNEKTLLEYLESECVELRYTTAKVLGSIESKTVRKLGIKLLKVKEGCLYGVLLLKKNYSPRLEVTMYQSIVALLKQNTKLTEDNLYDLSRSVLEMYRGRKKKLKTDLLEVMYKITPCVECRLEFLQLMNKMGKLKDEILLECIWDSNMQIRDFSRKLLKKKEKKLID